MKFFMMVEDEFGGRKMNDLRTIVWLNLIDSVGAPLWFGVTLAMMVLQKFELLMLHGTLYST
jgi:hypothetical protein